MRPASCRFSGWSTRCACARIGGAARKLLSACVSMTIASKPPPLASSLKPKLPASSWALRALVVVGVVFLLQSAKPLLLPVLIAVVLTFVLSGPVRVLRRLGIPESIGAAGVVSAVLTRVVIARSGLGRPPPRWWG